MRNVAIDTNLLLLLIIGEASRSFIGRHKRLKAYLPADFDLLCQFISHAEQLIVTPNALTEVSNLADNGVLEPLRSEISNVFRSHVARFTERYHNSRLVMNDAAFGRLGLTDSAWLVTVDSETVLLTSDLDLYLAALDRGISAYNFTHLRSQRGESLAWR